MTKRFSFKASERTGTSNATRANGGIPAVLYGHGLESKSLELDAIAFLKMWREAGSTSLIDIDLHDGGKHTVLIRDVQLHPVRNTILHVDFYQVRMDEKIRANVPLHFIGESFAVKDLGGTLVRSLDELDLEALPNDLPQNIEVDISRLATFDDVIHVKDLVMPQGVVLFHEGEDVIALVQEPKTQEAIDAELAEEIKEDVEGVEGVKDKEEPVEGEVAEGKTEEAPAPEEKKE